VYQLEAAATRPYEGRADASIVITEYSDFQCPACKGAVPLISYLNDTYGANIKIEYRHFPLKSIHQYAYDAAIAAECANDQGKFWQYHDLLFGYQPNLAKSQLKEIATLLEDVDTVNFNACLDSKARKDVVDSDLAQAAKLGLNSTPTFLYNGQIVKDRGQIEAMIRKDLGLPPLEEITQ